MSFELAVWAPNAAADNTAATALYTALCTEDSEAWPQLPAAPTLHAFYLDLTKRHPEIDDVPEEEVDNTDLCPWSAAFDRSDRHIIMSSVWSRAEHVAQLVTELAHHHGLAVFDPQAGSIQLPPPHVASAARKPWWRIW